MPVKVYYEQDANLNLLRGKRVAVIGYGSQGHAHAQNLRDSGVSVVVGLYKGSRSWELATQDGLEVTTVPQAAVRIQAPSSGFDWGDAGIGAAGGLALAMLGLGGAIVISHQRPRRTRHTTTLPN